MAMRWYSVSVLSNFEKKVAEAIKDAAAQQGLSDEIADVMVPTEEVIEIRRGKKVQTEKRFMPGYVLVKMEMTDRTYHLINSINRVTGFLGPQGKPSPMRDDEVARDPEPGRGGDGAAALDHHLPDRRAGERHRRAVRGLLGHGRGSRPGLRAGSRCRCRSSAGPPRSELEFAQVSKTS